MIKLAVVENMTKVAKADKPMLMGMSCGMSIFSLYIMHDLYDHEQEERFKDNIRPIHTHRHKGFRLWRLQGHQKVHCSTGGKIVIKKACAITSSSVHHSFWLNLGTHTCLKWCLLNLPSHHWPYPPIQGHRTALDNLCLSHITSGTWMDAFLTNAVATAEQQSDWQTGQQKSG